MITRIFFAVGLLLTGFLPSCSNTPDDLNETRDLRNLMVDVSEFRIEKNVLKDGEHVEIIGLTGNLTGKEKFDFYNLAVVRSEETGDTINVLLTTFYNMDLNGKHTQFISNNSPMGLLLDNHGNPEKIKNTNIKDLKPKTFEQVFYDTEYISEDVRKYPAITGNFGNFTIQQDASDAEE